MQRGDMNDESPKTIYWLIMAMIVMCSIAMLAGCKDIEYVTVPEVHEIHHHHTDSIHQTDSVVYEKETTIMQLDSAAMAQYGIQLKSAERAWLVRTAELERQIQQLKELRNDSIHQIDSIPKPYPVEVVKEVAKPLTWWQRTQIYAGDLLLIGLFVAAGFGIYRLWRKFSL